MAEFPALPLWTDAYLGDTTHLTTIEHGAYLLLLMAMWRGNGSLPLDDVLLARYARLNRGQWARIKPVLMPFFRATDGRISQGRLTDELVAVRQNSKRQSDNSKARWRKEKEKSDATAIPDASQPDAPLPLPLPLPLKEDLPAAAAPSVPREPEGEQQQNLRLRLMAECGVPSEPCPQYWRPHSADARIQRWRDELGLSDEQILSVAEAQRAAAARRGLDPPDGPKALQAAMEAAAGRADAPRASEAAVLRKFEDWARDPSKRNLVPKTYLARIEGKIAT